MLYLSNKKKCSGLTFKVFVLETCICIYNTCVTKLMFFFLLQPTLHFFKDGKKATEIIGADIIRMKNTMEELYK